MPESQYHHDRVLLLYRTALYLSFSPQSLSNMNKAEPYKTACVLFITATASIISLKGDFGGLWHNLCTVY